MYGLVGARLQRLSGGETNEFDQINDQIRIACVGISSEQQHLPHTRCILPCRPRTSYVCVCARRARVFLNRSRFEHRAPRCGHPGGHRHGSEEGEEGAAPAQRSGRNPATHRPHYAPD